MPEPTTPESHGNIADQQPLTLQLARESQSMISKLKDLKLDESSAPGMAVFGENGTQIAIFYGKISVPETPAGQEQAITKEKHLVISPKGLFLAEGRSDVEISDDSLISTLDGIRKKAQENQPDVSIDEKNHKLRISASGGYQAYSVKKVEATPEQFSDMLKAAIENSRKIAQKPLLEEIARIKAGNGVLDNIIAQENSPASPPPASPGPTA